LGGDPREQLSVSRDPTRAGFEICNGMPFSASGSDPLQTLLEKKNADQV
jgi:hypothetical protein